MHVSWMYIFNQPLNEVCFCSGLFWTYFGGDILSCWFPFQLLVHHVYVNNLLKWLMVKIFLFLNNIATFHTEKKYRNVIKLNTSWNINVLWWCRERSLNSSVCTMNLSMQCIVLQYLRGWVVRGNNL